MYKPSKVLPVLKNSSTHHLCQSHTHKNQTCFPLRPRPVTLPVVAVASRAAPAQTTQFFVAHDVTPGVKFVEDKRYDWLIFTKSHSDWSTVMRLGRSQDQ